MKCPSCSRENRVGAQFCDECGDNLVAIEEGPAPSGGLVSVTGFVGRHQEMAELKVALEDALGGRGRLVMLVGEPGIGKTRTAQELAAQAEQLGAQVFWGRCNEEEGAPPYWPWVESIRLWLEQKQPEQLQPVMGPGAADIAEIIPEVRQKLPDLEPPPPLVRSLHKESGALHAAAY